MPQNLDIPPGERAMSAAEKLLRRLAKANRSLTPAEQAQLAGVGLSGLDVMNFRRTGVLPKLP